MAFPDCLATTDTCFVATGFGVAPRHESYSSIARPNRLKCSRNPTDEFMARALRYSANRVCSHNEIRARVEWVLAAGLVGVHGLSRTGKCLEVVRATTQRDVWRSLASSWALSGASGSRSGSYHKDSSRITEDHPRLMLEQLGPCEGEFYGKIESIRMKVLVVKRKRFSVEQITGILKQAEYGAS